MLNTYDWKNQFTQVERQALIALFSIPRDIHKTKVVTVSPGIDRVEEDGVSDSSLAPLSKYTIAQLKDFANGVAVEEAETGEELAPPTDATTQSDAEPAKKKVGRPKKQVSEE